MVGWGESQNAGTPAADGAGTLKPPGGPPNTPQDVFLSVLCFNLNLCFDTITRVPRVKSENFVGLP